MAKIGALFSGSSGNCTYISSGNEGILVDVGVSCKQLLLALDNNYIEPENIRGVFITHTHSDHIKGLRVFLKKYNVPIFASDETLKTLIKQEIIVDGKNKYFDIEKTDDLGFDMKVDFFRTSHDCEGSGGYKFTLKDGESVAVCTDLGVIGEDIKSNLLGCKAVVLESNHDVGMLQNGCYPYETKQRILSNVGHLSNVGCAEQLPDLVEGGTTRIILAHLSKDNNTPELARVTSESVLAVKGMKSAVDYLLSVAPASDGKIVYI